jgi:hypothetical protein
MLIFAKKRFFSFEYGKNSYQISYFIIIICINHPFVSEFEILINFSIKIINTVAKFH